MDNYGSRGNGSNKYTPMNKNHRDQKYRRSTHDDEMYLDRDDYYKKSKKPDQNFYHSKQQQQSSSIQGGIKSESSSTKRYEVRQTSESRSGNYSNNQQDRAPKMTLPPTGQQQQQQNQIQHQRINSAAFKNLPMNIDSLPPRLKRKYLKDAGLPEELADKPIMEIQQQFSYSLPYVNHQGGGGGGGSSGASRYNHQQQQQRYDQYHQNSNFQSKYNNSNQNHHQTYHSHNDRNSSHHRSRSITPTRPPLSSQSHQKQPMARNEWKPNNQNQQQQQQQQHVELTPPKSEKEGSSFDWSEDVLNNSHSLQHDSPSMKVADRNQSSKYDDHNHRQRNRRRRNRSASSNGSVERYNNNNSDNFSSGFKMPFPKSMSSSSSTNNNNRQRRNSQSSYNSRENSMERSYASVGFNNSRENSLDRRHHRARRYQNRRGSDNYHSSRENSTERFNSNWSTVNNAQDEALSWRRGDELMGTKTDQEIAELRKQFENSIELAGKTSVDDDSNHQQRVLFDPNNPNNPIVVKQVQSRSRDYTMADANADRFNDNQQYSSVAKPVWFKKTSEQYQKMIKSKRLIDDLNLLDNDLVSLFENDILTNWQQIVELREKIQKIFEELLRVDMKFCQAEHVEHYFWKLLYYRMIEILRKQMQEKDDINARSLVKDKALEIVDSGTKYFESLLLHLEFCHKFKIEDFIGENAAIYNTKRGLGYVGLALVSAQKIFLFLGDLARYREQINLTNNFGRAKNYYVKAQQIVPKNGRPFNQLALLAVYSKRKIDAVYFYMRSLMSSNPFLSAKESLVALFDEIRKKYKGLYEFSQRKREEKNRLRLKEKEYRFDGNLRKETWIHPEGGSRFHRTGPLDYSLLNKQVESSDDEELDKMDASELNKRFIISFLHVQGKLITKVGMDSFHTCATQMLKEFRALLHISPIPINSYRILQLLSLNMYAIDCNTVKFTERKDAMPARSEVQECAITVSLLMFGIIVERLIEVLKDTLDNELTTTATVSSSSGNSTSIIKDEIDKNNIGSKDEAKRVLKLNEDSIVILPAIKVWTDYMFYNETIWNPPPTFDLKISVSTNIYDLWTNLASLMTTLETVVDVNKDYLVLDKENDCTLVRLSEDITMAGFTPLNKVTQDPIYCRSDINVEIAQNSLRLQKLMFFGTDFLCKCKPQPILKKTSTGEYISIVQNRASSACEIILESFSDEEDNGCKMNESNLNNGVDEKQNSCNNNSNSNEKAIVNNNISSSSPSSPDIKSDDAAEIRRLLRRKDELERKQKMQEERNERFQDILSNSSVALHIEVRPRYLIPDTNTFIDDLELIEAIARAYPLYQLMIPIIVLNELEGLSRGMATTSSAAVVMDPVLSEKMEKNASKLIKSGSRNDPKHVAMVTQASKKALTFLNSKNPAVKCVTTKGSIIQHTIFTSEDGQNESKSNDDKILDTAMSLSKKNVEEKRGDVRFIKSEVVLLTTDRNLRVKAITNDIVVRELHDFIRWAGLGS